MNTIRGKVRKLQKLCLVVILCIGPMLIIYNYRKTIQDSYGTANVSLTRVTNYFRGNNSAIKDRLLVDTEGCKILNVNPFDEKLKVFYAKLKPYKFARNIFTDLVFLKGDRIYVNNEVREKILAQYNIFDQESMFCCVTYLKIYPVEKNGDNVRFRDLCKPFLDSIAIEDEYMKISCFIGQQLIYEKFDVKVMKKLDVETRCKNILQNAQDRGVPCEDQLSVLIIGIDSMSRLNFHRQLPQTRKVLTEDLDGIQLLGYNKAGEYTFSAMMPFLTGFDMYELEDNCEGGGKHPFDKCTFLWDIFGAAGYRTAFVEDMNKFGLLVHQKKGIHRQPADYYGRVFLNALATGKQPNIERSWRNVSYDEAVVQWAIEFQEKFVTDLHFGYFWISFFSHDNSNTAQHIDMFLPKYLKHLKENKLLNNTLLLVMSDHGMRFGKIRNTDIGRFEAKLPFAYFVVPKWYQEKYPTAMENLRRNADNRFTTAFDMHKTLKDIAQCKMPRSDESPSILKGIDLFGNISPLRTCKDAGIDDSFCSCLRNQFPVPLDSTIAETVSRKVYEYVSDIAARRPDICAELHLKNVTMVKAETELAKTHMPENKQDIIYTVTLFTKPGDGMFEGTVIYNAANDSYTLNRHVRRTNRYGTTSSCVTSDPLLRPICYCLVQEG